MLRSFVLPHIPFLLPELGGDQIRTFIPNLISSLIKIHNELLENPPDAILICSPHFNSDTFSIGLGDANLEKDLKEQIKTVLESWNLEVFYHISNIEDNSEFLDYNIYEEILFNCQFGIFTNFYLWSIGFIKSDNIS